MKGPGIAIVGFLVGVMGCASSEPAARTAEAGAETHEVRVKATEFAFAPAGPIPAGVTRVVLEDVGRQPHHLELYRLGAGKTLADLVPLLAGPAPLPPWVVAVGGPGAVEPGETVDSTMLLDPGSYAYVCYAPDSAGVPHYRHGMVGSAEIAPRAAAWTAEPAADLTLRLYEYGFEFTPELTAGAHTIRVENAGAQTHQAFIFRLDPGRSQDEFVRWTNAGEVGPPPGRWASGQSALAPGRHAYFTKTFEAGEYILVCYVSDDSDGKPHFLHGMVRTFTVR
jgi:plastocyanin